MDTLPEVRHVTIADLTPDEENANTGTARGGQLLEESLQRLGAGRSIVIDRNGRIIGGNKTVNAAAAIGLEDVIVVQTDGTKLVAVQRTDLDLDADESARQLAIADNRVAQIDLHWDPTVLAKHLTDGIDLGPFFEPDELTELLGPSLVSDQNVPGEDEGGLKDGVDPDTVPGKKATPTRCKSGDVWALGPHRLMCGDATSKADVSRLFDGCSGADGDDGKGISLLWTDPPTVEGYVEVADGHVRREEIAAGKLTPAGLEALYREILANASVWALPGAAFYILAPPANLLHFAERGVMSTPWVLRQHLVWVRSHYTLSRADYLYQHDPILAGDLPPAESDPDPEPAPDASDFLEKDGHVYRLVGSTMDKIGDPRKPVESKLFSYLLYGWVQRGSRYWADNRTASTVLDIPAPPRAELYPIMRPVELVRRCIENSTRVGDLVYDPCAGTGTTLITCTASARICYTMEIDPGMCDVILARYEQLTGREAVRLPHLHAAHIAAGDR